MTQSTSTALEFAHQLDKKLGGGISGTQFMVIPGKVYDKIIVEQGQNQTQSVHAFVVRATGELVKAATWNAPQKSTDGKLAVRFDLHSPIGFHNAVAAADKSGSYLYAK